MLKKALQGVFLILMLNLLIKPLWIFGIDRKIQNDIGLELYGSYYTIFGLLSLLVFLIDLGINNHITQQLSNDKNSVQNIWNSYFPLKLSLIILYSILATSFGYFFGYVQSHPILFFIVLTNGVLAALVLSFRAYFSGLLLFNTDSFLSVFDRALALLIMICYFIFGSAEGRDLLFVFLSAQTLSFGLALIVALILLSKKIDINTFNFNGLFGFKLLKTSFPYAFYTFLMYLYSRVDILMIDILREDGNFQNGIYAQSYRLVEATNAFTYLFGVIFFPFFGKILVNPQKLTATVHAFEKIMFSLLIPIFCCIPFFGKEVMELLYTDVTESSIQTFHFLFFYGLFFAFNYLYGALVTASGVLKKLNILAAICISFNMILNLFFIPEMGAKGAALASFFTQLIAAISLVFLVYSQYLNGLKSLHTLFKILSAALISVFLQYIIIQIVEHWILALGLGLLLSFLILWIAKVFSPKLIFNIFGKKEINI